MTPTQPTPECDCGMPHLGGTEHADECPAGVHNPTHQPREVVQEGTVPTHSVGVHAGIPEHWAIRRRNGGIDGNDALLNDPRLFGDKYGEWVPVEMVDSSEVERLRAALEKAVAWCYPLHGDPAWLAQAQAALDGGAA